MLIAIPLPFERSFLRLAALKASLFLVGTGIAADGNPSGRATFLPEPILPETFDDLKAHSPFHRTIDLSDSLVLTGMARIEGQLYATLFDSESAEFHVISETINTRGWQIVGVRGDENDLESMTAKVQVEGGEVVSIRYAKVDVPSRGGSGTSGNGSGGSDGTLSQEQIESARRAARNPAEGFRGDGYRGTPPQDVLEKLRRISPQQREQLARRVMQMRNNGVESEVRQRVYREGLDRAARQAR